MCVQIKITLIVAAVLAGTAAIAYAQGSTTEDPGKMAPGNLWTDRLGSNSGSTTSSGGFGTLGAGDTAVGNWTGTNSGINRGQTGSYPLYGSGHSDRTAAPGGNGTLGAGDTVVGGWAGTNPGIDRRSLGGYYYGLGRR